MFRVHQYFAPVVPVHLGVCSCRFSGGMCPLAPHDARARGCLLLYVLLLACACLAAVVPVRLGVCSCKFHGGVCLLGFRGARAPGRL